MDWKSKVRGGLKNAHDLYAGGEEESTKSDKPSAPKFSRRTFDEPAPHAEAHNAFHPTRKMPLHQGLVRDHHRHKES